MSSHDNRRNKNCSERSVQTALMLHILGHWAFFALAMGAYLYFIEVLSGDPTKVWSNLLHRHGPTIVAMLVFSPIILRDICKLSNRFAGPIVRLRRGMQELADGQPVKPIHFRERDFWLDLATNFNRIAERLRVSQGESATGCNPATVAPDVKSESNASLHDAAC